MSKEQNKEIFGYRTAGRQMLESIKNVQQLHINLVHHLYDPNPYLRAEYNKIRYRLGSILRTLAEIEKIPEKERVALPALEAMKIELKEADKQMLKDIDALIRKHHITGEMATSLMNDNYYANNISRNLLKIGKILFKSRNQEMHEVEQSLMLDDTETADAIAARHSKEADDCDSDGSVEHENK